jgi:hypothetical protein
MQHKKIAQHKIKQYFLLPLFIFAFFLTGCSSSNTSADNTLPSSTQTAPDGQNLKVINWCLERDNRSMYQDGLWISSDYFSGMRHAPTVRHVCRAGKELFYLEMVWDDNVSIHTGVLVSTDSSGEHLRISSLKKDPLLVLLDEKNKPQPGTGVWFTIDEDTFFYDEKIAQFTKQ